MVRKPINIKHLFYYLSHGEFIKVLVNQVVVEGVVKMKKKKKI